MDKDREVNRKSDNGDSDVGYCRPPKKYQFKKGKSGNPKGRPKSAEGLKTDLKEELASKITVKIAGQEHTGTKQRLALKALTIRSAMGDLKAINQLIGLMVNVVGVEDEDIRAGRLSKRDQELLDQLIRYVGPKGGEGKSDDG